MTAATLITPQNDTGHDTAGQHALLLAHIEDFVFFVTMCGMDYLAAARRCGVNDRTMDKWLEFLAAHPEYGRWHAGITPEDAEALGTLPSKHVLDCRRNHQTVYLDFIAA